MTAAGLRIIDFDDCGRGSVEFEVGNTLYMALFDAWNSRDLNRYRRFRSWFVDSYERATSLSIDGGVLDHAIEVRARALGRWLARTNEAPIGIRSASAIWRATLRAFVDDQTWRAAQ